MSHQPFKRGPRRPGSALSAMLRGSPRYLPNPADAKRRAQKLAPKKRKRKRRV